MEDGNLTKNIATGLDLHNLFRIIREHSKQIQEVIPVPWSGGKHMHVHS